MLMTRTRGCTELPPLRRMASASGGGAAVTVPDTADLLLPRAAQGDQQAWNQIVDKYTNLLWSIGRAHRLDSAAVNDVVQTTWLRLLENIDRIREPERLASWLATTARRECLRWLRHAGRESPDWHDEYLDNVPSPAAAPIDQWLLVEERDALLWQCFRQLPARCQQLLRVLMAVDPPSYAEISEALGLPVGSIGPTRMRCVKRLRELTVET